MRTKIITLAGLAVSSFAQAQTGFSITGNVDVGYRNTNHTNAAVNKSEIIHNNASVTSVFFKGEKDLGKGLQGSFNLQIDPNPSQSSTLNGAPGGTAYTGTPFNSEQFLGLSGAFGSIKLGTPNAAGLIAGLTASPFGTTLGGGISASFGRLGTTSISGVNQFIGGPGSSGRIIRHEKSAIYATPSFNGLKVIGELSFANSNSTSVTSNTNEGSTLALQYSAGPWNAIYALSKESAGGVGAAGTSAQQGVAGAVALPVDTSVTWNLLAANYKFDNFTLYGGYTTTKHNATTALEDSKSWNVALKYALSDKVGLMANYLVRDSKLAANADASMIGLGLNYALDPSTSLYVRYEGARFIATAATGEQKQDIWATGIQFKF